MDPGYVPNIVREPSWIYLAYCVDVGTLRAEVLTIFFIAILYVDGFAGWVRVPKVCFTFGKSRRCREGRVRGELLELNALQGEGGKKRKSWRILGEFICLC